MIKPDQQVEKLGFYIIAPDDIDSIVTNIPQGEIRKAIMRINCLRAKVDELQEAIIKTVNDGLLENPIKRPNNRVMEAMGWTWVKGKLYQPGPLE